MFHFVANLKPYTYNRGRGNRRFDAYLLSVDFAGGELGVLAERVVSGGRVLCADNGNVDRIRELIRRFKPAAVQPQRDRKRAERGLTSDYARPGELPTAVRDQFRALARHIATASKASIEPVDIRSVVADQAALDPAYLIAMEDFSVATLTALSVEPEYSMLPPSFYRACTDRALRFAEKTKTGAYGSHGALVFAGLHALDYDTAFDAGRMAGDRGVDGIATGLVGALTDKNYVDYRIRDGQLLELAEPVPRPYLRVLEIAAGLHAGYATAAGSRPRFHALGAGSPILIPLLGLLGDRRTYTATDSTSPIVDGWTAPTISLYVDDPAPLKYKAHRIAQHWLTQDLGWRCTCPYCRAFNTRHPPDVRKARAWWRREGSPRLTSHDLASTRPLAVWLPLLGRHPDDRIRTEAGLARVGHNHWVVQRLERAVRRHARTRRGLRRWVNSVVDAYQRSPASPRWKAAVRVAHDVAIEGFETLATARSSPLG